MTVANHFVTPIYRARLSDCTPRIDGDELVTSCYAIAEDDEAGQDWCEENGYPGYTSYASLTDLPWRFPIFADLVKALDAHVAAFVSELDFDLGGEALKLEDIWINILPEGGNHTAHIHPHSVISGTTYVAMPDGAGRIKFEDPRLPMLMAAPQIQATAPPSAQRFHYVAPQSGDILMWESWLRHEVMTSQTEEPRISVSFNYALED